MVFQNQAYSDDGRSISGDSSSILEKDSSILEKDDPSCSDSESSSTPGAAFIYVETPKRQNDFASRRWGNADTSVSSMSLSLSSYDSSTEEDDGEHSGGATEESDLRSQCSETEIAGDEISGRQTIDHSSFDDFTFTSCSSSWDSEDEESFSSYEEETIDDREAFSELGFVPLEGSSQSNERQSAMRLPTEGSSGEEYRRNLNHVRIPRRGRKDDMPVYENGHPRRVRRTQSHKMSRLRTEWERERAFSFDGFGHARSLSPKPCLGERAVAHVDKGVEVDEPCRVVRRNPNVELLSHQFGDCGLQPLVCSASNNAEDQTVKSRQQQEEGNEGAPKTANGGLTSSINETTENVLPCDQVSVGSSPCKASKEHGTVEDASSKELSNTSSTVPQRQAPTPEQCESPRRLENHSCELGDLVAEKNRNQSQVKDFISKNNETASTIDTHCLADIDSCSPPERRSAASCLDTMGGKVKTRIKTELNVVSSQASKLMRAVSERTKEGFSRTLDSQEFNDRRQALQKSWNGSLLSSRSFLRRRGFSFQAEDQTSSDQ
eukprot:scaffold5649_cov130-Cylindrotheca_fusiformis.AAC.2